ncbi:MAG: 3'-phosphoadenosine 5'-phosphosulfate sulfotransferase [Pycnora praestabilis]|nr:MAG: 3'-phosphoadenosine 5'-phosphosulfate sulfotransferase [Pycnora praestabilis]
MTEPSPMPHNDQNSINGFICNGTDKDLRQRCAELNCRINEFLSVDGPTESLRRVQEQTRKSLGAIREALERYSLEELSLSYNGGKDCLVLLILFLAALAKYPHKLPPQIQSVYIVSKHPFTEVDEFVDKSSQTYALDLARYVKPMKYGFEEYLQDKPTVKAIFVGTRRTDPHGAKLTFFDQTDHGWPSFMRIHPVIDWHYAEIWTFIRRLEIPYCSLYDMGYTSLGGTTDTHPNPALRSTVLNEGQDSKMYRPAYELVEDEEERLGRDR